MAKPKRRFRTTKSSEAYSKVSLKEIFDGSLKSPAEELAQRWVAEYRERNSKVPKIKGQLMIWICPLCLWVTVSDQQPHRMDVCKCEKSGLDFEREYSRAMGSYMPLLLIDLDKRTLKKMYKKAVF